MHEASLYPHNCFVTLTYDDEHLPSGNSLNYRDFQLFIKRLRKHYRTKTIRFYMCGEYGSQTSRPHFHACLFNIHFSDNKVWKQSDSLSYLHYSPTLNKLWPFGHASIGALNRQTAAYTARYIMQKITGDLAPDHYGGRTPEFNRMSLRPGIGAAWFDRFHRDVYAHDHLIADGSEQSIPKYYDKLHKRLDQADHEATQFTRYLKALPHKEDQTPARLHAKDQVTKARIRTLKRTLA